MKNKTLLFLILSLCLILPFCFIPSFAADDPPSDLTGLTIVIPGSWSATAGYGVFNINGTYNDSDSLAGIAIGYSRDTFTSVNESANSITFNLGGRYQPSLSSYEGFSFTVTGGPDVSNPSLISWLADNGAFSSSTEILRNGYYSSNNSPVFPDLSDLSLGEGFSFIAEPGSYYIDSSYKEHPVYLFGYECNYYDSPNDLDIRFFIWETADVNTQRALFGIRVQNGISHVIYYPDLQGNRFLRFYNFGDVVMDDFSYDVINALLKPSSRPAPPFEGNPWVYILDMIIEALQVNLFGYFSVWDIFSTICGIFLLIWLLKLLAGG